MGLLSNYSPTFREEKAVDFLSRFVKNELNFDRVVVDEVGNLIASYGRGDRSIALIGHIDTVQGFIPVIIDNGLIWGRGAVDAKGPLTSAFIGASSARDHVEDVLKVYVIALVGEEGPSHGAWNLVRKGVRFNHVVICEPSAGTGVVVEYRGSLLVKVKCSSKPGHTATQGLNSACDKLIDYLRYITSNTSISEYIPSIVKLACGEAFNVIPKSGYAYVSLRIPFGVNIDQVIRVMKLNLPSNCKLYIESYVEPVKVPLKNLVVRSAVRSLIKLGLKPKLVRKLGTSDMNIVYGRVSNDVVAYGPGDPKLSHTEEERISIDELILGAKVYESIIKEIVKLT